MPKATKNGVERTVNRPRSFGWQISDEYMIAGVVIIPKATPIIARPIIS